MPARARVMRISPPPLKSGAILREDRGCCLRPMNQVKVLTWWIVESEYAYDFEHEYEYEEEGVEEEEEEEEEEE